MEIINPFEMHTARYSVPDPVDVERPRSEATNKILKLLKKVERNRVPRIIPILGEAGYGKTHLYWTLKSELNNNALLVYTPSPSSASKLFAHIYFSILKNYGVGLLQDVSNILTKKYSLEEATTNYPGKGAVIVEFFFALQNAKQAKAAKMWLAGNYKSHLGDSKELIELNEDIALTALRIILENSPLPFILFLDEIETCFFTQGEQEELLLLENLKRLYNEADNFLIVLACVTQIWDKITELSSISVQGRIERPVLLKRFKCEDLQNYVEKRMQMFWNSLSLEPGKQNTWPFNDQVVEKIYKESGGNPRDAIKYLHNYFEQKRNHMMNELENTNNVRGKEIESIKSIIDKTNLRLNIGTMSEKIGQFFILSQGDRRLLLWNPNDELLGQADIVKKVEEFTQEGYQKIIVLKETDQYVPGSVWFNIKDSKNIIGAIQESF